MPQTVRRSGAIGFSKCSRAPIRRTPRANIGDLRTTDEGAAVIHIKGNGGKERRVPIESELLSVIETYLDCCAVRFPGVETCKAGTGSSLARWSARLPLFVGRDGQRITQGSPDPRGSLRAVSPRSARGCVAASSLAELRRAGWVVVKPARLRAFEVGVGHVLADPGAVPRAGPPTHDLPP